MLVSDWQASPSLNTPDLLRGTYGMGKMSGATPARGRGAGHGGGRPSLLTGRQVAGPSCPRPSTHPRPNASAGPG